MGISGDQCVLLFSSVKVTSKQTAKGLLEPGADATLCSRPFTIIRRVRAKCSNRSASEKHLQSV